MFGPGQISDDTLTTDRNILDVSGEAMRQRQEQHQTVRLIQHLIEDDVAVKHDMGEITMREHSSLGPARRAGSVDDSKHVVRLDARYGFIKGAVADPLPEIGHRIESTRTEVEHIFKTVVLVSDLLQRA